MTTALFLFHRDLRLTDNTSLIDCIKEGNLVLPVFIFLHKWHDSKVREQYPEPMVDYQEASADALNEFKQASR